MAFRRGTWLLLIAWCIVVSCVGALLRGEAHEGGTYHPEGGLELALAALAAIGVVIYPLCDACWFEHRTPQMTARRLVEVGVLIAGTTTTLVLYEHARSGSASAVWAAATLLLGVAAVGASCAPLKAWRWPVVRSTAD